MEPINYLAQVADPFAQSLQGLQLGAGMAELQQKQAAMVQQQQRQQLAAQEQAKFFTNPNPTMRDAARYASLLSPEQANAFRPFMEGISKEQQQGTLRRTGQLLSSLQLNPTIAVDRLKQESEAARNSGDAEEAALFDRLAAAVADPAQGPSVAFKALVQSVSAIPGAKDMLDAINKGMDTARSEAQAPAKLREAEAAASKAEQDALVAGVAAEFAKPLAASKLSTDQSNAIKAASDASFADKLNQSKITVDNWNVKNLQSQINDRVAKFKLDQAKTAADVTFTLAKIADLAVAIPDAAKVEINKAAVAASASKQQSEQLNSLANRITDIGTSWGRLGSFNEWLKKSTGSEGAVSELRQEFTRLRNTAAIQSLPPGPATDKDIQMALSGFPSDTSDPKVISSFLRGMAKMQDLDASVQSAKVDWMSQNKGSLGRAPSAFIAGDLSAKAGETFADFTVRVSSEIAKRYQTPQAQIPTGTPAEVAAANRGQIPVAGQPAAAPTTSIRSQADAIIRGGS
jgi:hypothetical protein